MVLIGQEWMYSCKEVVFEKKSLYSVKSGCIRQSGCIRSKWLYLDKSGSIQPKVVVFKQSACVRRKWLNS